MNITEVRVFIKENVDKKLKAFCTVTFDDCFVVRDVKVIEGNKGLFVAMPSRRMKSNCPKCGHSNPMRSRYCSGCGANIEGAGASNEDSMARKNEHKDIAHPITLECREYIQKTVLEAYEKEASKPSDERQNERNQEPKNGSDMRSPSVEPAAMDIEDLE